MVPEKTKLSFKIEQIKQGDITMEIYSIASLLACVNSDLR